MTDPAPARPPVHVAAIMASPVNRVQAFLAAFAAENPSADIIPDELIDFFDVQAFLNAYSAGCP